MINTIAYAVHLLFNFLQYAIFIDVILSWVMPGKNNSFTALLHIFTEPFMRPGRMLQEKIMPGLMIDFSPILALFILWILQSLVNAVFGAL
ncbi:MAG: hypothetical protein K0R54_4000 [Clostridiaceae bacterium]|jgi:YggT family protein|nr:hypothetical protein [Clostridiaceae bacterium]